MRRRTEVGACLRRLRCLRCLHDCSHSWDCTRLPSARLCPPLRGLCCPCLPACPGTQ